MTFSRLPSSFRSARFPAVAAMAAPIDCRQRDSAAGRPFDAGERASVGRPWRVGTPAIDSICWAEFGRRIRAIFSACAVAFAAAVLPPSWAAEPGAKSPAADAQPQPKPSAAEAKAGAPRSAEGGTKAAAAPAGVPLDPQRVAEIAAMLPPKPRGMGPTIDQREPWRTLAAERRFAELLGRMKKEVGKPLPPITDDDYLDYSRTGNRTRGQKAIGARFSHFADLVLAECLEGEGRFLPDVAAAVRSICEDKSWTLPAHDGNLRNFKGIEYSIDLHVAAVAWNLATADYWLGDRLPAEVRALLRTTLRARVFDIYEGYLERGRPRVHWAEATHNWNAVCTAGVTGAALAIIDSPQLRARYIAAAERNTEKFLSGFTDDGYCSEGVGYWNYGFGHFLYLAETLHQATGGKVDLFALPKVRAVAQFGRNLEILPGIYPAFADCSIGAKPDRLIEAFMMRRLGLPLRADEIGALGPAAGPQRLLPATALYCLPSSATARPEIRETTTDRPLRSVFDQAGIVVCRGSGSSAGFGAALKGGHNAEHHNHNDVGSFVVALGESTPLLDPGLETYTARTFSGQRYVSNVLNSFGHPVPRVAGQLQRSGRAAAAKVLRAEWSDRTDVFALDLSVCYEAPSLRKLTRTFTFSRDGRGSLTVEDRARFDKPEEFETALVTLLAWRQQDENLLRVGPDAQAVEVVIETSAGRPKIEAVEIKENLPQNRVPVRIGIALPKPAAEATIRLTIQPAAP